MNKTDPVFGATLTSENDKDIPPGSTLPIELPAPTNGRPFFWGYEIPEGKKVFLLSQDVVGTSTLKLKFYNSEPAGTPSINVRAFTRQ
ncbi:hypothetical protein HF638_21240 [Paenibacillus sp. SZ31]|uniref:hypothetical protein n=1 Tax=Paenibacillus sp. SZ31 TaxID=2725555 RepID=UPI00146C650F|nr:hypothetical protein [Paenibacillus sp. SZ31]NMI06513.1 hypothetical protein [Paenibacillus sp. SZ31]